MDVQTKEFCNGYVDKDWAPLLLVTYAVAAEKSPDPSTQNAASLYTSSGALISAGINEFPRGVQYLDERWERPLKYKIIEHAERNAIYYAARWGHDVDECTMVSPWAACTDCARAIIQAGVKRLVRHQQASDRSPAFWHEDIVVADQMLHEAGVEIVNVNWSFAEHGRLLAVRHSGETWNP